MLQLSVHLHRLSITYTSNLFVGHWHEFLTTQLVKFVLRPKLGKISNAALHACVHYMPRARLMETRCSIICDPEKYRHLGLAKNGGIDKTAVYNIKGVRHIKLKQSLLRTWNNAVAGQWRGDCTGTWHRYSYIAGIETEITSLVIIQPLPIFWLCVVYDVSVYRLQSES